MLRIRREIWKIIHRERVLSLPLQAETGLDPDELTGISECLHWFTWSEAREEGRCGHTVTLSGLFLSR